MAGFGPVRLLVLGLGAVCLLGGLAILARGAIGLSVLGVWAVVAGVVMIVAALLERVRYRSDAVDRAGAPAGPGGGEPLDAPLDPRFQRTDEVFADPTSGLRMRVWLDPRSGERQYRADDRSAGRTA